MTDHTPNSLRAVITSLREIVGPSVDPADPLAQQQLTLSLAYLEFLGSRLAYLPARDRFELEHHLGLAAGVVDALGDGETAWAAELCAAMSEGQRILGTAGTAGSAVRNATAVIAAHISQIVESDLTEGVRKKLEVAIVQGSARRIEFDRAWYAPMGFDPNPTPDLQEFLAS